MRGARLFSIHSIHSPFSALRPTREAENAILRYRIEQTGDKLNNVFMRNRSAVERVLDGDSHHRLTYAALAGHSVGHGEIIWLQLIRRLLQKYKGHTH